MGALGWTLGIIIGIVILVFLIKILTNNDDSDEEGLEKRMSVVGKLWDKCCAKKKGRHRI